MFSPNSGTGKYEIWLFAGNDYRHPVQECGSFREKGSADRMAGRLRDWLHLSIMSEGLMANAEDAYDRQSLLTMRDTLTADGIDPATVTVSVRVQGAVSDNAVQLAESVSGVASWVFGVTDVRAFRR